MKTIPAKIEYLKFYNIIRRFFGLTPFTIFRENPKDRMCYVKITFLDVTFWLLSFFIYIYFAIKNMHIRLLFSMTSSFITNMGAVFVFFCASLISLGCPIMNLSNRKRICKLINRLQKLDDNVNAQTRTLTQTLTSNLFCLTDLLKF